MTPCPRTIRSLSRGRLAPWCAPKGMTRFSRKAGMRRDSLYKMFTSDVSPAFDTVMKLLIALDIQLVANLRPPSD